MQLPARQLKLGTVVALGTSNAPGTADTVPRSDHVHAHGVQSDPTLHADATPSSDGFMTSSDKGKLDGIASGADVTLTALAAAASDPAFNNRKLTLVADPVGAQDAATKAYVDSVAIGLMDFKQSCRVVVTTNITRSGTQTYDGVALNVGDRVLMAYGLNAFNGILIVQSGAWSRAPDADASAEVTSGMFTFITEGTVGAGTGWVLTTPDPITLGTTNLQFTQFSSISLATVAALDVQVQTATTGASARAAKEDHKHNVSTAAPVAIGTGLAIGTATSLARSDHVHDHGSQSTGTHHAAATQSVNGFMSAADKVAFDAMTGFLKKYVKGVVTTNITVSGGAPSTVDGNSLSLNDRVLCAGQTTTTQNGIYKVTTVGTGSNGTWALDTDSDTNAKIATALVYCYAGTTYGRTLWIICESSSPYIVQQVGGQPAAATPNAVSASSSVGTAVKWAREDHQHGHGNQASSASALHALVVANGNSGFMSGADKLRLDNLQWKGSVKCASASVVSYNPNSSAPNSVDGISLSVGDRVLVKDHAGTLNGIWTVTTVGTGADGVWARATIDADTSAKLSPSSVVFVEQGTVNADTGWLLTNDSVTLGTTTLIFQRISLLASEITKLATLAASQSSTLGYVTVDAILETPATPAYSASLNLDTATKNDFAVGVLTGNLAITLTNPAPGRQGTIWLKQDATGGRTVSFTVSGYTVVKDTLAVDLQPASGANALTQYSYAMFAIGGTNYCQFAKSFLA